MSRARNIRPYSRQPALSKIDQRTREWRLMCETRAELSTHVGGKPNAVQAAIIEQLVQLKLRLAVMDRSFSESGNQTPHDSRTYLAWSNSYGRLLRQLGVQPAAQKPESLAEYLASRSGEPAAAA